MNFNLSSDSCVDELKDKLLQNNIHVIPMTVIAGDETFKDDFSSLDEYEDFYNQLNQGKVFKTASLNSVEVEEHFLNLLKQEKDIIHISLSSGLSVTCNVVKEVAEKLNAKNKNKIYVLDSLSATQGQKLLLHLGQQFRDEGMVAHEAFEKMQQVVNHLDVAFFVTDFDCLKRGGRVSGVQALIGKFANIRPMLDFDTEGKLRVIQKVIGTKKAIATLAERVSNYSDQYSLPFFIAHTGNFESVEELKKQILEKHPNATFVENYIGPTIGAHTGAGTLGLVFLGKSERV
jgi:DegV family protein with EDD domain